MLPFLAKYNHPELKFEELEIGPHFITLYTRQLDPMLKYAKKIYNEFITDFPEEKEIQQQDFLHEPNDPNVYHPFGIPNNFRKAYRHFHIRTPNFTDISWVLKRLERDGVKAEDFKTTYLENNRDEKFKDLKYPIYKGLNDNDYLNYIEELRTGKWIND